MKKRIMIFLLTLLLLPQVVSAKTREIVFYEKEIQDRTYYNKLSLKDELVLNNLGTADFETFENDVYNSLVSSGDVYTISLNKDIDCDDLENSFPGFTTGGQGPSLFTNVGNGLKSLQTNSDTVIDPDVLELYKKECKYSIKYTEDIDSYTIKIKPGERPKDGDTLTIKFTSFDEFLDMNYYGMELLLLTCATDNLDCGRVSTMMNGLITNDRTPDDSTIKEFSLIKDGKTLANLKLTDFTITIPNDVTADDNLSFEIEKIIDDLITILRNNGQELGNNSFLENINYKTFKIIVSEKRPEPIPIIKNNPLTVTNRIAIAIFCLSIVIGLVLINSFYKKSIKE